MADITLVHDVDINRRGDGSAPTDLDGDFINTWLDETSPNAIHGAAGAHKIGGTASGKGVAASRANGLYMFNLNNFLPADATIVSAVLHYFVYQKDNLTGMTFGIHRCTRTDWVENEATYNDYKTSTAWTSAGGDWTTPTIAIANPVLNWNTADITSMVTDAWTSRSGILTYIFRRTDTYDIVGPGHFLYYVKKYAGTPWFGIETYHIRVTYTLAGKTFEAIIQ